ncbi:hypothetical protein EIP91_002396 [Steccherinum ochraceum]|uniref:SGT1-domain-containing protein n=1 Tax=Steccherinum ochraceum TaxID=92696 RepID=A0A4R0RTZ2_9APHY|nr:hypothetical protein EIP91_002396 [Steccherinum ochraceum]
MDIFNRPPAISEDTVHYVLYPTADLSDKVSVTTLAAVIQSFVESLLPEFLWHRDSFQLKVVKNEDGEGHVLEGRMRVGDCVDDEWCAVWLLREISAQWDLVISANDSDGEFLLIEAAEYLPSWVTPSNAENRVWIYRSHLHLIPLSHVSAPSSKPRPRRQFPGAGAGDSDDEDGLGQLDDEDYLSIEDAVKAVRDSSVSTQAPKGIEDAVVKKLHGYPAAASQHIHHTKVYVPADIAKALSVSPSLVQKPVETFYTRDALQLRAAHKMTRFPPEPSVLTTVKMTRTAYAQLVGQKFFPPKIFGRWTTPEGTPERRWRDVGMKLACGFEMLYQESKGKGVSIDPSADGTSTATEARKESLARSPDYNQYMSNLKTAGYFKEELEGSILWKELEDKAVNAFLEARRDDDASRPSFASEFNVAISQAKEHPGLSTREEDSDAWLEIDEADFDEMLEKRLGRKSGSGEEAMNVDRDEDLDEEERITQRQTSKLQEMAKKVEEFVEGKGDLEGAKFQDEEFSDEEFSDQEQGDDEDTDMSEEEKEGSPEADRAAKQAIMDKLVPGIEPSEYGKMPASFHSNSQRVARTTVETDTIDDAIQTNENTAAFTSETTQSPRKPIRPPIIPRDHYDGVDSDDETDEEDDAPEDEESEEEKPQVVGEIEIDMEEEQEEFLEFARQALGVTDQQWAEIIQDRQGRGAYVPATTENKRPINNAPKESRPPTQSAPREPAPGPRPNVNPNLDSFEAVMEAMDAELGRRKAGNTGSAHSDKDKARTPAPTSSDKGKEKATDIAVDSEGDIEAAMDAELQGLLNDGSEEGGDVDDADATGHLDYNLIKNFLESFKSQNGMAGPVGSLVGRLQPGWTLPRDDS